MKAITRSAIAIAVFTTALMGTAHAAVQYVENYGV